jgi:hypothetical protein
MSDITTPLEEAILNAQDFAYGLAAMAQVEEMLTKSKECRLAFRDRDLPREVRVEALKESRQINSALSFVAMTRAAIGISA